MEDVEKKIEKMQQDKSANGSGSNRQLRGISNTKAPSLDMIRNEVKAALSKVSSSVDLSGPSKIPLRQVPQSSRQNLLKDHHQLNSSDEMIRPHQLSNATSSS